MFYAASSAHARAQNRLDCNELQSFVRKHNHFQILVTVVCLKCIPFSMNPDSLNDTEESEDLGGETIHEIRFQRLQLKTHARKGNR